MNEPIGHGIPVRQIARFLCLAAAFAALAGCQALAPPKPRTSEAPAAEPLPAPVQGTRRFIVRPDLSDVRILVYRAGPLAAFGHNHVVRAAGISGEVHLAPDVRKSGLALALPVSRFEVDPVELRAVEGEDFAVPPSAQAVAETHNNLLGAGVLDAENHPEIRVRSVRIIGPDWGPDLTVRIEIRGVQQEVTTSMALDVRDRFLVATGAFTVNQSDFGIQPFSILGGGLQVADTMKIRFRIVAGED
jgi:hypothetical protein